MSELFKSRLPPPGEIERALLRGGLTTILGVDEAGRGALCGPVFAACVLLPLPCEIPGVHDSKLLTPERRRALAETIEAASTAFSVKMATVEEIESINILQAALLAMRRSIEAVVASIGRNPDIVVVDGNQSIPNMEFAQKTYVSGDQRSLTIAAASILAKVARDSYMARLDSEFPQYGLRQNKGYGTPSHQAAIRLHGPTPQHRLSFCTSILKHPATPS